MAKGVWTLICSFVLYGGCAAQPAQRFTVVVYNDAGVPAPVLKKARDIAESIYGEAGVTLLWKEHAASSPGAMEFFVRIVPRALNLPGEDFGIAFVGSDGRGIQADIFYSGIDRMAKNSSVNPAEIMGHVMAHELGHLLLGLNSHSNLGIMQARWSDQQLRQMSMGLLKFDKRQSEKISARLLGNHDIPQIQADLRGY